MNNFREIAKESEKTEKARIKLKKKLEKIDRQVTQDGLKKKVQEIHHWISRHSSNRIVLRDKNISLFDENQNTAKYSLRIASILDNLKNKGFINLKKSKPKINLRKKIDFQTH
jgi:hypothetical protein